MIANHYVVFKIARKHKILLILNEHPLLRMYSLRNRNHKQAN